MTEIVASENASVDYYKLQEEADGAYHIATVETWQGQDSNVRTTTISLRGKLGRWFKLIAPGLIDRIARKAIEQRR